MPDRKQPKDPWAEPIRWTKPKLAVSEPVDPEGWRSERARRAERRTQAEARSSRTHWDRRARRRAFERWLARLQRMPSRLETTGSEAWSPMRHARPGEAQA